MKKGLYWCRNVFGSGQTNRSFTICKELIKHFDITFIEVRDTLKKTSLFPTIQSNRFHLFYFPTLQLFTFKEMREHPLAPQLLQETLRKNKNLLNTILKEQYAFFIIEGFPFQKREIAFEILSFIQALKSTQPECKIICSLRDFIPRFPIEEEQEILHYINLWFDKIYVHSDPFYYTLEKSFRNFPKIQEKIVYTGYVTSTPPLNINKPRKKQIIISRGSGFLAQEFFKAVAAIVDFFPDYHFLFSLGPRADSSQKDEFDKLQTLCPYHNVTVVPYIDRFEEELSQSALSLNLAGSTIYTICYTKTPSITYAGNEDEQKKRLHVFSSKGIVKKITDEDLDPKKLVPIIQEALKAPFPSIAINLKGAENTLKEVIKLTAVI